MIRPMDGDIGKQSCSLCSRPREKQAPYVGGPGGVCQSQSTSNGSECSVQRQFAHHHPAFECFRFDLTRGREDADGEGQVVGRTFLPNSGWCEVDVMPLPGHR